MANEIRVRADGVAGALSAALGAGATSMSSAGLADLPVIDATQHALITLLVRDSDGRVTKRETVKVTAHTAAATTATIVRAQEGTSDQAWSSGDKWVHAPVASDFGAAGAVVVIAEVVVGVGGAATIDFTSIPGTYRHLRMMANTRLESGAAAVSNYLMRFNADSGANYDWTYIRGNGAAASSGSGADQTEVSVLTLDPGATASSASQAEVTIFDYAGTTFLKGGFVAVNSFYTGGASNLGDRVDFRWQSTAAITRITLTPPADFAEGTVVTLYGMDN